jgi:hypothetical protein
MEETRAVRRQVKARRLTRVLFLIAVCSLATTFLMSKLVEHSYQHQEAQIMAQLSAPNAAPLLNGPAPRPSIGGQLRYLTSQLGPVRRVERVSVHGMAVPGYLPGFVNAQYRIVCARGAGDALIAARTTSYRYDDARILYCFIGPEGIVPLVPTKRIVTWGW